MFNKLVRSALPMRKQKDASVELDELFIKTVFVDQGPSLTSVQTSCSWYGLSHSQKDLSHDSYLRTNVENQSEVVTSEPGE